jgi:hypothetical protein
VDEFGTPKAKDPTARDERTVQEAAEYGASLDQAVKDEVSNRPLGSVKIPFMDKMAEYKLMRENPEHLAQFFIDQKATVEQMIQYAKEMESKL